MKKLELLEGNGPKDASTAVTGLTLKLDYLAPRIYRKKYFEITPLINQLLAMNRLPSERAVTVKLACTRRIW